MIKLRKGKLHDEILLRRQKKIGAYRVLFGKPKGRRLRGRSKHRSNDNVKIGLKERE